MIMKNDAKFEKKTDLWFGKWHEEFDEFWSKHYFSPKYIILELKEYRELCLMALKIDAKFEGKLTCTFKTDRNLANFNRLKNRDFILKSKMVELD